MDVIPCLTLKQPMASAIAAGVKQTENRPRRLVSDRRLPLWVGIHAGLGIWPVDIDVLNRIWRDRPESHPSGVVLGAMRIDWIQRYPSGGLVQTGRDMMLRIDPWASGPWCHRIGAVRLLEEPVPARGMQGLWPASGDALEALRRLLA